MRRRSIGRRFSCNVTPCDTTCSRSISCNIYRQIISNRIIFKLIAVCSLCLCGRVRKPNMSSCISSTFSSGYICSCSCSSCTISSSCMFYTLICIGSIIYIAKPYLSFCMSMPGRRVSTLICICSRS